MRVNGKNMLVLNLFTVNKRLDAYDRLI